MSDIAREALAEVLDVRFRGWVNCSIPALIDTLLDSDWLAQAKATARAEALREAAEDLFWDEARDSASSSGYYLLIDRADAIDGGAQ